MVVHAFAPNTWEAEAKKTKQNKTKQNKTTQNNTKLKNRKTNLDQIIYRPPDFLTSGRPLGF